MQEKNAIVLLLCLLAAACEKPPEPAGPRYAVTPPAGLPPVHRLAVHPLHNPQQLAQAYLPLIDLLNQRIPGVRFELEASRDYAEYERKIKSREPELLLPNPVQTLSAIRFGYQVLAMAGEARDFRGIFLVRKDSEIRRPADLMGRALAYPAPTALAACIMPQWFLHEQGLDPVHDLDNRYVGSQESAILNVLMKQVDVGVTWPPPWRIFQREHPRQAAELHVIWETPPLINNSVMVRRDLPPELGRQVLAVLLELSEDEEGRRVLAGMQTARFRPAADADYEQVRTFLKRFEAQVRKVDLP